MHEDSLLGNGMTAEVYAWEDEKVLKLYYPEISEKMINYEASLCQAINKAGISAPAMYEIITVEGRKGIVFQRIFGKSMLKLLEEKPWHIMSLARQMARLHSKMHEASVEELPTQKERLTAAITESADLLGDRKEKILAILNQLPNGLSVCHGDFHPDNILVTETGMVTIDWTNAYLGHPMSDVARTYLLVTTPFMPPETSKAIILFSKVLKKLLYSKYIKEYFRNTKMTLQDFDAWILPVAAARLREKIPGEKEWLLEIIDRGLKMATSNKR